MNRILSISITCLLLCITSTRLFPLNAILDDSSGSLEELDTDYIVGVSVLAPAVINGEFGFINSKFGFKAKGGYFINYSGLEGSVLIPFYYDDNSYLSLVIPVGVVDIDYYRDFANYTYTGLLINLNHHGFDCSVGFAYGLSDDIDHFQPYFSLGHIWRF